MPVTSSNREEMYTASGMVTAAAATPLRSAAAMLRLPAITDELATLTCSVSATAGCPRVCVTRT